MNSVENHAELFESCPVSKAVAALSIPTIIGMLVSLAYNLADTFFVGLTNDPNAVAAVSLAFAVSVTMRALASLFGVGGESLIARCLGAGEYERARRTSACCIFAACLTAALFSTMIFLFGREVAVLLGADESTCGLTAKYIFWVAAVGGVPAIMSATLAHLVRAGGNARQSAFGISLGGILNIGLDPLFMFVILPEGQAVAGAAIATMLSNAASAIYFLLCIRKTRNIGIISCRMVDLRPDRKMIFGVVSIGLPSALQMLLGVASNAILNRLTGQAAELLMPGSSAQAIAGLGITKKLDMLPMYITMGLAQGVLPLLGYCYGAGRLERMLKIERFSLMTAVVFSLVCSAAFETLASPLVGLFIDDALTVAFGAAFLKRLCVTTPFMAVSYMLGSMFQAAGKGRHALTLSLCRKGIVDIPVMYLMNSIIPLYGLMWTQPIVDLASTVLALTLFLQFKRNRSE